TRTERASARASATAVADVATLALAPRTAIRLPMSPDSSTAAAMSAIVISPVWLSRSAAGRGAGGGSIGSTASTGAATGLATTALSSTALAAAGLALDKAAGIHRRFALGSAGGA